MVVGGQSHTPLALGWGREPLPILWKAGLTPRPIWTGEENFAPTPRFFCSPFVLYAYFFVLISQHFVFCPYSTTHSTKIHAPGGIRNPQSQQMIGRRPSP